MRGGGGGKHDSHDIVRLFDHKSRNSGKSTIRFDNLEDYKLPHV